MSTLTKEQKRYANHWEWVQRIPTSEIPLEYDAIIAGDDHIVEIFIRNGLTMEIFLAEVNQAMQQSGNKGWRIGKISNWTADYLAKTYKHIVVTEYGPRLSLTH